MKRVMSILAVFAATLLVPAGATAAQTGAGCAKPTVQALTFAEAAVSRPAIASPAEYPVSNVYALVEQATRPTFTYAEAGPQYAGAFEALVPAATPPPPRAVSAFPSEDIPDEDTENWGGTSQTATSETSARASSAGAQQGEAGGATAKSSRSWAVTRVDCDVVTIIAGWEANDVVLAPGAFVQQMGETVTLVVGPDGSSADVDTTLVGAEGVNVPSEGRPLDPFSDPIAENGGPTLEAGEPRSEAAENGASASGGSFNVFFGDPETGQGGGYSIGSVRATIEVIGPLVDDGPPAATSVRPQPPPTPAAAPGSPGAPPAAAAPVAAGVDSAVLGEPPAPAVEAVAAAQSVIVTDDLLSFVSVERRSWIPLFGLIGLLGVASTMTGAILIGQREYPTLAWIVDKTVLRAGRFAAVYLRW